MSRLLGRWFSLVPVAGVEVGKVRMGRALVRNYTCVHYMNMCTCVKQVFEHRDGFLEGVADNAGGRDSRTPGTNSQEVAFGRSIAQNGPMSSVRRIGARVSPADVNDNGRRADSLDWMTGQDLLWPHHSGSRTCATCDPSVYAAYRPRLGTSRGNRTLLPPVFSSC